MNISRYFNTVMLAALSAFLLVQVQSKSIQTSYDFIIVGGGTGGLALAARLTEGTNQTVLVLEAGSKPGVIAEYKPPLGSALVLGTQIDWGFVTPAQKSLNGRSITYHRGRCLGGSSAINGLTYGRGSSSVYDLWESSGNPGWSWSDVFPFFKKSTTFSSPSRDNSSYRTYDPSGYSNGPVQVGYPVYSTPASFSFIEAIAAIGLAPISEDLNLGNNIGTKQEPITLDTKQARSSSYDAYYKPAENRTNLEVLTYATVQQIIMSGNGSTLQAAGVVVSHQSTGEILPIIANKEVILAAGTFQTPQLLMLSGIGPADVLERNGIKVKLDSPYVGMNMQDHTYFSVIVRSQPSTSLSQLSNDINEIQAGQAAYKQNQTGPFTSPGGATFGFQKLSVDELTALEATELLQNRTDQAHIEYYYEAAYYPTFPALQYPPNSSESYISLTAGLVAPVSRGNVTLQSNSVADAPVINLNYFEAETDQKIAIYAFKQLRKILAYHNMAIWGIGPNNGEVVPGVAIQSDADILEYIRSTAIPVWHASGTCAMKPQNEGGVVDSMLKVYGVKGLRIADASVMPVIPDQHTQGPVYMIAEKAASMIKFEYGF